MVTDNFFLERRTWRLVYAQLPKNWLWGVTIYLFCFGISYQCNSSGWYKPLSPSTNELRILIIETVVYTPLLSWYYNFIPGLLFNCWCCIAHQNRRPKSLDWVLLKISLILLSILNSNRTQTLAISALIERPLSLITNSCKINRTAQTNLDLLIDETQYILRVYV